MRYVVMLLGLCSVVFAKAQPRLADGFVQEQLAEGLNPSAMAFSPDGRLFIVEKGGRVLVYRDGRMLEAPFLELDVDDTNERGLSGITFHPDFERNGYFYVYYTVPRLGFNRISRFRANGDFTVPGSEEVVFELDPVTGSSIHNGGAMVWLPDTTLLVAVGDGGRGPAAQEQTSLLGKMLRLADDGSVPGDNPFAETAVGKARAIYAFGFRNPFSMDVEAGTGRVFSNDVGGSAWEEINVLEAGGNYGWPLVEGRDGLAQAPADHVEAVYAYDHDNGCAVVGASFYQAPAPSFPEDYHGRYLFGDYCLGEIRVLDAATYETQAPLARGLDRVVALAVDSLGQVYYLGRGTGDGSRSDNSRTDAGSLWRIRYTGDGAPVVSRPPRTQTLPRGDTARFSVSVSGRPPYEFEWLRDGRVVPDENGIDFAIPEVTLGDDGTAVRAVVRNAAGVDTSAAGILYVTTNTRPTLTIAAPAPGSRYRAGEVLAFSGAATDAEDGGLDAEALTWHVDFHHDDHRHPVETFRGVRGGSVEVPRFGEVSSNVFYRVTLAAEDAGGLRAARAVDVHPETAALQFRSVPAGLIVNADGLSQATPYDIESVQGLERVVAAPRSQTLDGEIFAFSHWSGAYDTTERVFRFEKAAEDQRLVANYVRIPKGTGTGLTGEYYSGGLDLEPEDRELVATRVDSVIDFAWAYDPPLAGMPTTDYFVKWTGDVEVPVDGEYRFITRADDGVRLWVDGALVIDAWQRQKPTYYTAAVELVGGRRVPIRMEYFQAGGYSEVSLAWGHDNLPESIVPRWALYPERAVNGIGGEGREADFVEFASPTLFTPGATRLSARMRAGQPASDVELSVTDGVGRAIARAHVAIGPTWTELPIRSGDWATGVYVVVARGADGRRAVHRVVVQ